MTAPTAALFLRAALRDPTGPKNAHMKGADAYMKHTEIIGSGAFGTVFLGTHKATRANVVLKEVNLKGLTVNEVRHSLEEVLVLKKLDHPGTVAVRDPTQDLSTCHCCSLPLAFDLFSQYFDAFHDESAATLTIVMEECGGGDLSKLIEQRAAAENPLSEPELVKLIAQAIDALAYLHDEKILHRDVKPANIFLSEDGDVKLGDFGVSRLMTSSAQLAQTECGTPLYYSPELAAGRPYDRAADVWALGCTLYALATLQPPWTAQLGPRSGMMQLFRLINVSALDLTPVRARYSPALVSLLESCLAKQPSQRLSFKQLRQLPIIATALQEAPAPSPLRPPPPLPPSSPCASTAAADLAVESDATEGSSALAKPGWHLRPQTPARNRRPYSPTSVCEAGKAGSAADAKSSSEPMPARAGGRVAPGRLETRPRTAPRPVTAGASRLPACFVCPA